MPSAPQPTPPDLPADPPPLPRNINRAQDLGSYRPLHGPPHSKIAGVPEQPNGLGLRAGLVRKGGSGWAAGREGDARRKDDTRREGDGGGEATRGGEAERGGEAGRGGGAGEGRQGWARRGGSGGCEGVRLRG
ncbi:hypothetical protein KRMM14A1004_40720 [Krasilnikovia sp. MM14-A1004]